MSQPEKLWWRQAFETAPIGMALVATDGGLTEANQALCDMLGYSHDELCRLTFHPITHPDDLAADVGLVTECLDGQRDSYRITKRYLHNDGHVVWADLSVTLLHADGKPAAFIAQVIDMSELHADRERLIHQAAVLRQQQDALRHSNQLLESFAGTVSHDLKTPLAVMAGWLDLIGEGGGLSDDQDRALERVRGAAGRLADIVDALLMYASTATAEAQDLAEVHLRRGVVEPALASIGDDVRGRPVRVEIPDDVVLVASAPLLQTAIANLVVNAVKHHPGPGSAEVTIRLASAGERLRLSISDDGRAPDGDLHLLIRLFARGADAAPGHGIGLATVERIVQWHGGLLDLGRTAAGGLEVVLDLPAAGPRVAAEPGSAGLERPVEPLRAVGMETGSGDLGRVAAELSP